jgi:hypothetical protein
MMVCSEVTLSRMKHVTKISSSYLFSSEMLQQIPLKWKYPVKRTESECETKCLLQLSLAC